ncbi:MULTISPECIES: hypothetical protein [Natrinema]|uniref:Uncharacterized protein n=2 Tax=Natrinema TaxID=88723 RepID=A0A2A5QWP2_9EURY|nr:MULTISPECIES: hypothetical protein [Natrinema]MBZ6494238.1 hypothetical protein [Natrinema longum]PCR91250.1 hypothetical protein CP557_12375 [Natrinema ejinorense]QSW84436.1 hypothetical protein J0X27_13380 [Natrinema longum]
MASNRFDGIDMLSLVLYPITTGMVLGIWTWSVTVFGGYDFSQGFWSYGSTEISVALALTILSFAWIVWSNEFDGTNYSQAEFYTIVFVFAAPILYALVPFFATFFEPEMFRVVLYFGVCVGAVWTSYTE